ncbi:hypothetical protein CANARDRAFT_23461 [[Candida] arabinofermentans NRRL YB-2248]|uniref:Uncharacterized protein n=1 Tax=[Candida] arabinofermentans NRRL YB-2248 TaxID=983967 RepID=A0A1E4SZG7_9ASCO|nr:hypothetical protein CANARDRAFT_23461 [[Candida] arabinofermentans NRRL YB-2248]
MKFLIQITLLLTLLSAVFAERASRIFKFDLLDEDNFSPKENEPKLFKENTDLTTVDQSHLPDVEVVTSIVYTTTTQTVHSAVFTTKTVTVTPTIHTIVTSVVMSIVTSTSTTTSTSTQYERTWTSSASADEKQKAIHVIVEPSSTASSSEIEVSTQAPTSKASSATTTTTETSISTSATTTTPETYTSTSATTTTTTTDTDSFPTSLFDVEREGDMILGGRKGSKTTSTTLETTTATTTTEIPPPVVDSSTIDEWTSSTDGFDPPVAEPTTVEEVPTSIASSAEEIVVTSSMVSYSSSQSISPTDSDTAPAPASSILSSISPKLAFNDSSLLGTYNGSLPNSTFSVDPHAEEYPADDAFNPYRDLPIAEDNIDLSNDSAKVMVESYIVGGLFAIFFFGVLAL